MKQSKTFISYTLYTLLVAFVFTACSTKDNMIVKEVKYNKVLGTNAKYTIVTDEFTFISDVHYKVGDTLYISRNNCY